MVKVKILGQVFTTQYGVLKTGDVLSCGEDFAKHLINDCGAAEMLAPETSEVEEAKPAKRGRPAKE